MEILKNKLLNRIMLILSFLFLLSISLSSVNAADVHMNSTNNTIANVVANQTDNSDTIYLDTGTYNHSHLNGTNGITINKNLTIIGKDPKSTIIDAQNLGRIFNIIGNNSVTLINITFINGYANTTPNFLGGAILYNGTGLLNITNCIFKDNNADTGGAIYCNVNTSLLLKNCNFTNNVAYNFAGAIYFYGGNITNCVFDNNLGNLGGAIFPHSNVIINNSTFKNNIAEGTGGAIFNSGNMIIADCIFTNNTAESFYGGAIFNSESSNLELKNSSFNDNSAGEFGGAISSYKMNSTLRITNCNFTNNTSPNGGAISNEFTNMILLGCNIINNSNGIYIDQDSKNNIINYNRIFNNTEYNINNAGINTNVDFNWWGNNTLGMTKIIGVTPNNYFIMNVNNLTSLDSNGTVTFDYTFNLNNGENAENSLLPYFTTDFYTNLTGVIESFDARFNNTFDVTLTTGGNVLYAFVTDNEIQNLNGTITLSDPVEPEDPTDPTDPVDPIDPVDPVDPENPLYPINPIGPVDPDDTNNTTETSNNPTAKAAMKETGIPIIAILIVLLSSLGLIIRKK